MDAAACVRRNSSSFFTWLLELIGSNYLRLVRNEFVRLRSDKERQMYHILNGITNVEGLRLGRVYVIEAPDGLTLVDTGAPDSFLQIEKDLKSTGHQVSEIKRILITHAHWDHF